MRWGQPASRLTHEEQLDEILARAADDWVDPGDVFDVARYAWPIDEDAFVEQAIGLVSELVLEHLLIPGDVTREGFHPWPLAPREACRRIAEVWRSDHAEAQNSFFVWFEATSEGDERGRRAWLVDRPIDD
ncbi:hypothetical protein [Terrabacter sp. 2RAF25]|uniref:hypothetical protein n=1 Tax=Terrabacter sp. 2RAF25 TaxID=3232998 RepID=UPI003F9DBFA1